ncbi:MAG: PLD nuclease N-terminal domain-containing protein [Flavobacteriaceae bacterium]|nr:PLD nuclease N-terminal domain-containing protein [Flavobacteriaceae bacterium]
MNLILPGFAFLFFLAALGFWIFTIVDIVRSQFKEPNQNILWLLLVILAPIIGIILYWIMKHQFVQKEPRRFNPEFNRSN